MFGETMFDMYVWRNYVWHVCLEKWNSIFSM